MKNNCFDQESGKKTDQPDQREQSWKTRIWQARLDHGWQWLLYIDVILPLMLFMLAWIPIPMRTFFAQLYHQYSLYIMKPIPNFDSLTGVFGLLLHTGLIIRALIRHKWLDLSLCLTFLILLLAFFSVKIDGIQFNYWVIRFLDFGVQTQ